MITEPHSRRSRRLLALLPLLGIALPLAACSEHASGDLGRLQQIAESCPDRPVTSQVQYDGSGSSAGDAIAAERLAVIASAAERTAVCGGTLTVTAFSSSSGATATVFSEDLTVAAPTDNARFRQVPERVAEVTAAVGEALGPAIASLPGGGSDVTSSYRLMGEHAAQFPDARFEGYLLTDGLTNVSVRIEGALSPEQAEALASQVPVPSLPSDSRIVVAGLGRVSGDPVPSPVIEGMVAFYDALCARTGATECRSVTDWR